MTAKATKATPAPALKLVVGEAAIKTELKAIFAAGQSYQARVHIAACSVLQHVGKHSDVRLVDVLLASMPELSRKTALMIWLAEFGPIAFDEHDKATFVKKGKTRLGNAMAMPFWKLTVEKPYQPIDIAKFITGAVKKLERDQKETKVDHTAMIRALNAMTVTAPTAH